MKQERDDREPLRADDRFAEGAERYADYLRTVEGRLRLDLAWANLKEFIDAEFSGRAGDAQVRRALDAGGGTGALALRLAHEGWRVHVLDSSAAMLDIAAEQARRAGVAEHVAFHREEAERATEIFGRGSFDLVVCHNVVEYVEDPSAVAASLAACLRVGGIFSLMARNRAGELMRAAVKAHDLEAARDALTVPFVRESLYGGPARLFDAASLGALVEDSSCEVRRTRGVRVIADYLPPELSTGEESYARLLSLETELGARNDFAAIARYTQVIARRSEVR